MQHLSEVAHILGAALVGDTTTVRDYAALLTSKLTAEGEGRQAHTLRTVLRDVPQSTIIAQTNQGRDEEEE